MKIKDNSHELIAVGRDGHLWNNLNEEAKAELLASYEESFDTDNLLPNEQVKLQHEKWLKSYSVIKS